MSDLIIYHNGQCTKSRGALELLIEKNIPHTVRWYVPEPFSEHELTTLLHKLGMPPSQLVRRQEQLYKDEYEGKDISEAEWLAILLARQELIERPIIEKDGRALVARPAERIFELL